ncbi:hypothetical protein [Rhodococcus sp. NCIMB 12038]|uniref:hypothetical protein n=1 Tax=Rhodococcus sp. NCIMB 12038 TaxID=933800 RepID=UPI000B3C7B0E|nr:hypothetical protein [Rhodococcus sp. NCIMB 12038]OUS93974.1 hypothetical protein CA951_21485 [Rhodococcus sp. NCIMB 12038]
MDVDDSFASLPEETLTRFDASQWLAIDKRAGALDFTEIDYVFIFGRVAAPVPAVCLLVR